MLSTVTSPSPTTDTVLEALARGTLPDARGRYGPFGGRFVPETLMPALERLDEGARRAFADPVFRQGLTAELASWVGRPTPLTEAPRLAAAIGARRLFLKREDLAHTGAHKINNALGQAMLAKRLGAKRVIAETGAGQHGVATAAACARLGLPCTVFMGAKDVRRQAPNVDRMRRLGAEIRAIHAGDATLRSAIDEALRCWVADPVETFYLLGSAVGPHPYPFIVRELQAVIGREARRQLLDAGGLPDAVVACVGGGSNAIGMFHAFLLDRDVDLYGFEAGGVGDGIGENAATAAHGRPGVLHGSYSLLIQDDDGQVQETHSVSAGLDYPGVGPEHALLGAIGRANYLPVGDAEALEAFDLCTRTEGIIPALESSHAIAGARRLAATHPRASIAVCLSGRGDKDLPALRGDQ